MRPATEEHPAVFLDRLVEEPPETQFLAIWGQLLDLRWRTRPEVAAELPARAATAQTTAELEAAFPIPMR